MTEWLTVREVANGWRMSPRTVGDRIRANELPATKIGRQWLIRPADVNAYEQARRNVPTVRRRLSKPRPRPRPAASPSIGS